MKLNIVPARHATLWVNAGLRTFWKQPLGLFGLFFVLTVAVRLCSEIPVVGAVLAMALLPAVTLAMLAGAAQVARERTPSAALVVGALQTVWRRAGAMAVLGVLHAVGFLLALGLSSLVDGGEFARFNLGRGTLTQDLIENEGFRNAAFVTMLTYLPMSMMLWHAPALVHWHRVSPIKSLFFSLVACLRNLGGLLLFALIWSGITFATILLVSVAMLLLGSVIGAAAGAQLAAYLMATATMAVTAMFMVSVLFTFRDSFFPPDAPEALETQDKAALAQPPSPPVSGPD